MFAFLRRVAILTRMKKIWYLCALILIVCGVLHFTMHKQDRLLLVTGCARSGTKYISRALRASGYEIGHEKMSEAGVSSWYLAAAPKKTKRRVNFGKYKFAHIFHQVRHPLSTISSVYKTENVHSWKYIISQIPEIRTDDSHLVKCAKYWYYWNLKAEKLAEWTYRVEDLDQLWDEFGKRIGKAITPPSEAHVPKNTNTRGEYRQFSWEDLRRELDPILFQEIQKLAVKYGYSIE
jgi:hypothetical protein